MTANTQIKLPAKLENLELFSKTMLECAEKAGIEKKRLMQIEIALEEILVNIFNYSYPDSEGDVTINCATDADNQFTITITDSGIPFDMTSAAEPDLTSEISERAVGGLGIHFVKKMMDEVEYQHVNNLNILKLKIIRK